LPLSQLVVYLGCQMRFLTSGSSVAHLGVQCAVLMLHRSNRVLGRTRLKAVSIEGLRWGKSSRASIAALSPASRRGQSGTRKSPPASTRSRNACGELPQIFQHGGVAAIPASSTPLENGYSTLAAPTPRLGGGVLYGRCRIYGLPSQPSFPKCAVFTRISGYISRAKCRAGDVTAANIGGFSQSLTGSRESIEAISRLRLAPSLSVEYRGYARATSADQPQHRRGLRR
jgi:hypothetical protein